MLFDFALSLPFLLNVIIVILAIIFFYLLFTRIILKKPVAYIEEAPNYSEDEIIVQERELRLENLLLEQTIKKAKKKYLKKKIKVAEYKKIVQAAKDKIQQNQVKLKQLGR